MRVILAGIFIFASLLGAVVVLSELRIFEVLSPVIVGIGGGILLVCLCAGALMLFNRGDTGASGLKTQEEQIRALEKQGALVSTDFRAVRAIEIEEYEDEGSHYFIELADGAVLYLNGQYLYDYEELTDDPELNQRRRFPCSEFTIRRHRTEGYVADIDCRGAVLEPEMTFPHFTRNDFREGRVPEDGEVLRNRNYDEIKSGFAVRAEQKPFT
jgi:hypothetical protein